MILIFYPSVRSWPKAAPELSDLSVSLRGFGKPVSSRREGH